MILGPISKKTEVIAGLSDQHGQLFCWTDAVFAGLGHRSGRLFRRLYGWVMVGMGHVVESGYGWVMLGMGGCEWVWVVMVDKGG